MRFRNSACFLLALLGCALSLAAGQLPGWTDWLGPNGYAQMRARLRDKAENAAHHTAAVEVEVQDVWLNYPEFRGSSGITQAVLQYQVDQGPAVVTVDTRLRFEKLTSGKHTIMISLIGIDNRLVVPRAKLEVSVP